MMNHKSLLVVDDERSMVDLVSHVLRREGYGVLHGKDGIDAFTSLFLHSPSLMLIDLCLPAITGLEVIEQIRRDCKTAGMPIVAMSGDDSLLRRAIAAGADAILAKPFTHQALMNVISRYFGKGKTRSPMEPALQEDAS